MSPRFLYLAAWQKFRNSHSSRWIPVESKVFEQASANSIRVTALRVQTRFSEVTGTRSGRDPPQLCSEKPGRFPSGGTPTTHSEMWTYPPSYHKNRQPHLLHRCPSFRLPFAIELRHLRLQRLLADSGQNIMTSAALRYCACQRLSAHVSVALQIQSSQCENAERRTFQNSNACEIGSTGYSLSASLHPKGVSFLLSLIIIIRIKVCAVRTR